MTVAESFHQLIMMGCFVSFCSFSAAEGGVDLGEVGQHQLHLPPVVGAALDGVPLEVDRGELCIRLQLFHLVPVGNLGGKGKIMTQVNKIMTSFGEYD